MKDAFVDLAADLGFGLDAGDLARFRLYRDRLATAGFNLSALRDPAAIEQRHFLESLAFAAALTAAGLLPQRSKVIDIGSGAGFPGLPLKLVRPDLTVLLLDSLGKRCRFLEDLIADLGLSAVEVIEGRAEEVAHRPELREVFDLAVARAVAPLPVLLEYSLPFLRLGGSLAATKGSAAVREVDGSVKALTILGGALKPSLTLDPPGGIRQTIIVVEKVAATPAAYPRRPGVPSKRPLA